MHFIFNALFLLAGLKWGNWREWKIFYPTILFFISGDLLKNFLLYNYWMWTYQETFFGQHILKNHTIISLMIMFIVYPSTVLIYLGRFPNSKVKQVWWIIFWISLYSTVEYINLTYLNLINHYNGWNIWWSVLFNSVMFLLLKIHERHHLLALGLSFIWMIFLLAVFEVPFDRMK